MKKIVNTHLFSLFTFFFFLSSAHLVFSAGYSPDFKGRLPSADEIPAIQIQADAGDAEAQFKLGLAYARESYNGNQVQGDPIKWLQMAADQGHMEAKYQLGMLLWGRDRLIFQGFHWLKKAAEQGHTKAQVQIANVYLDGIWDNKSQTGIRDHVEARKWYSKAADSDHTGATIALASMYAKGLGGPQDRHEALKLLLNLDKNGLGGRDVQVQIGILYYQGVAGIPDEYEAVKYFRKAANTYSEDAAFILSLMYERREGDYHIPQNSMDGLRWVRQSRNSAHVAPWRRAPVDYIADGASGDLPVGLVAQRLESYVDLRTVPSEINIDKSEPILDVIPKLASKGDPVSQYVLGLMYKHGFTVERDWRKAEQWFRKCAEGKIPYSHYRSKGTTFTYVQHELGNLYFAGENFPQNDILAYMWYKISFFEYTPAGIFFTHRTATEAMKILESRMSPEELELAKGLAKDWVEKYYSLYFYPRK